MRLVFIETAQFSKLSQRELADEGVRELQNELLRDPLQGRIIQGAGGCRKTRFADASRNKGKRGGYRIIYFLEDDRCYLLDLFSKNEASDLTPAQKQILKRYVKEKL
jgi:hypothetical protein